MASSTSSSGPLWNALGEFLKQPTSSAFKDWETEVLKVLWDNDIRNQKTFNMLSEQHFESIGFSSVGKRLELVSLQSKGLTEAQRVLRFQEEWHLQIEIFLCTDAISAKTPSNVPKPLACCVCKFQFPPQSPQLPYPGRIAQSHAVSRAHILPNPATCTELGLPWDASNFLPLCGAKDEAPSCHAAFDNRRMCFIFDEDNGKWHAHCDETPQQRSSLNGVILSLPVGWPSPHKRALHGHAAACVVSRQIRSDLPTPLAVTPHEEYDLTLAPAPPIDP